MALHSNTLDALHERIGRLILRDWKTGTTGGVLTGGSTSTFVDTSLVEVADYFQETVPVSKIKIRTTTDGADPVGEIRTITDWTAAGTGTIDPVWTTTAAGDTYAIYKEYEWDEVTAAINTAIDMAAKVALVDKIDHSVALVSGTYEYAIPSGFIYIYRISMANGDGEYPDPIPPDQWSIVRAMGTPRIHLHRFPAEQQFQGHYYTGLWADGGIEAGRTLRIEGYEKQEKLVNDYDICKIDPTFVTYQASALLHAARIRKPENEPDDHRTQYGVCKSLADEASGGGPYYTRLQTQLPADCRRVYS